jgi:hypothetical protein
VLRTVAEAHPDWAAAYSHRSPSESFNSWVKHKLPKGRSPAKGAARVDLGLLLLGLARNLESHLVHRERTALLAA